MKALYQKLPLSKDSSFIFERYESPYFETPLHYHEEIEIVLCDGGYGKKVIGNHTSEYHEGDIMILGSNLPHLFQADSQFYKGNSHKKPASVVIQFRIDSFGNDLLNLVEFQKIKNLIEKSEHGIEILGEKKEKIKNLIKENLRKSGFERFLTLLEILNLMANCKQFRTLSQIGMKGLSTKDSERMHAVFDLLINRYKEEITVIDAASLTHFSKEAFCRYFKTRTQKTFLEYLIDIRISQACKLLRETDLNILEICYESGFNNLSNFNRQFRKKMKVSPLAFRKQFND